MPSDLSFTRILRAGLAIAALACAGSAFAADLAGKKAPPPPPPSIWSQFDIAFGAKFVSDYNFRGISQTNRKPGIQGYAEFQAFNNLVYAGIASESVTLPSHGNAEIDLTAGVRPVLGPVSFDFGMIYYWYPGERPYYDATGAFLVPSNTDFAEIAAKASWAVNDKLTIGANLFYAWDWLNTGAPGTYASATAKYLLPFLDGLSVSGEFGHYWLGTTDNPAVANVPDYFYWNAGVSYNWKQLTLDLRYHDTDLSKRDCFAASGDPKGYYTGSGRSRWCGPAVIATVSFDTTLKQLGVFAPAK